MFKWVTRYLVTKYNPETNCTDIIGAYCYTRQRAQLALHFKSAADFSNYALYGLQKIKIRVDKNSTAEDVYTFDKKFKPV